MAAVERPPPANNRRRPRDHAWGVVKPSTAHRRVVSQPAGPVTVLSRRDMFEHFQPWVVNTYGDSAKTKTITQRKYARIVKTLRGEESNSAENSKFRFWVKAKGFRIGPPPGQPIRTEPHRHKQLTLLGEPELYVPTTAVKVREQTGVTSHHPLACYNSSH
ncbi:hypothetical protein B566_EDAN002922 [Ephemera danica]|nr:hypothetical protein B566_EDAN002922 [Ephemera danica]